MMNYLDIKTMVYESFSEFQLSSNFTLAESDFYDIHSKRFSEYNKNDLYIILRKHYNEDIAHFIISHTVENKYIEPFENWSNIPLWYYNAFSFGGAIKYQ